MLRTGRKNQSTKTCVEQCRSVDVRQLQRTGRLFDGMTYGWSWSQAGRIAATIDLSVSAEEVLAEYGRLLRDGRWERVTHVLALERTPCHLGGERVWWRCPVAGCNRRAAILYCGSGIACRTCHDLAYRCQRESAEQRAARQVNKIRRRLGWNVGILNLPGGKPKGMHWKTYLRLVSQHTAHSSQALAHLGASLKSLTRKLEAMG